MAAFDLAESRDHTDPRTIELQASVEAALAECRQLARKVGTTPARQAVGLRAKAGVLGVLLAQSGASGTEAELTRSLIADLNQVGELEPADALACRIEARYDATTAHNSRHTAPVNDAYHDRQG